MKDKSEVDAKFLDRAKQLAKLGSRLTSPNPKVGAVIVSNGKIIGEGYHHVSGQSHAEVNALQSVSSENQESIKGSSIYVSLEPCSHFGRTPPCSLAIIDAGMDRVVLDALDVSEKVNGNGVKLLQNANISVTINPIKADEPIPHEAFQILTLKKRPKIILKFAQSSDGFLGQKNESIWLTNPWSKRLVHRWRSEVGAIIVGTNTYLADNPSLTTRFGFGDHPLRIIPDFNHRIKADLSVFSTPSPIWILVHELPSQPIDLPFVTYKVISRNSDVLTKLNDELAAADISELFVEGGAQLLTAYLKKGLWDEARILQVKQHLGEGIAAPELPDRKLSQEFELLKDTLKIYRNGKDAD